MIYRYDMRAIFTAIHGFTYILEQQCMGELDSRQLESIQALQKLIKDMISTHDQSLEILHQTSFQSFSSYNKQEITEQIEQLRHTIEQDCTKRSIHFSIQHRALSESIMLPAGYFNFMMMLTVLVDNAIQGSPEGGRVILEVRTWEEGVLFEITDQGRGIPAAEIPLIYQYFWRNPDNYVVPKREYQTGIKLALLKKIVRQLGGWLQHESSETGTTARMWLPNLETA